MKKCLLFIVFGSLVYNNLNAQRFFEVDDIRYRVITEADEASTYGTASVAKLEFGEYEDDIKIPNVVKESEDEYADAYKVIGIDEKAFAGAKYLESVELPPSIETIGNGAFCESTLKSISIPVGNLTELGNGVFGQTLIRSVVLPPTIKKIGNQAFADCMDLLSVVIGEGTDEIGSGTFLNCINLETVSLPSSMRIIGDSAFCNCIRLDSIALGAKIKRIGDYAFFKCVSLHKLILPEGIKDIGHNSFRKAGLLDIVIPQSIKEIKDGTFSESMLRSVILPDRLRSIGKFAFCGLILDSKITVPEGTSVNPHAFEDTSYDRAAILSRRSSFVKNNQKNLEKLIIKHKDVKRDYGKNSRYKAVFIIDEIVYDMIVFPADNEEYGSCEVSDIRCLRERDKIKIPDLIEITDGPNKGKYLVTYVPPQDTYGKRTIRYPITMEYCFGEPLIATNNEELSYKSVKETESWEGYQDDNYKNILKESFEDLNDFLNKNENIQKYKTFSAYTQEFLYLYEDAVDQWGDKNGTTERNILGELSSEKSITRKYIKAIRKKLYDNLKGKI